MKNILLAAAIATFGLAGPVAAKEQPGQGYFTGQVGGVYTDNDRGVDDDIGLTVGVGKAINENWNFEFSVFYGEYDGPNNQDQDLTAASIGMMRVFYRDERISPYLLFAGGYHETARDSGTDDSNIMGEVAFGLLTSVGERGQSSVAVRAEVRWRADFQEDDQFNEFIVNIGVHIPFGKARE